MSTTVSYKGNTITTVNNETKTLSTSGKWLEGDITLTDVSGGGSGWLPSSAVLVASADDSYNLSTDTSWDSWTPSTTSTTILGQGTTGGACSYTYDPTTIETKALICACCLTTDIAYTGSIAQGYLASRVYQGLTLYTPLNPPKNNNANYDNYGNASTASLPILTYYSSETTTTSTTGGASYSVGANTPLFGNSSQTANTRKIYYTRPNFFARCHSTYFTTAAAAAVDSANSYIRCSYRMWLIDKTDSIPYMLFDGENGLFFQ